MDHDRMMADMKAADARLEALGSDDEIGERP